MSEQKFQLNERQSQIIREYLEENYIDVSSNLPIDHDMVIRDITSQEGFFESTEEANEFFDGPLYREYSDAGRHQTLQTYEGYADFFKRYCDLDLAEKDYSAEMGDIPDDLEERMTSEAEVTSDAEEVPQGEGGEGSSDNGDQAEKEKNSEKRMSAAQRDQAIQQIRDQQPRMDKRDIKESLNPEDQKSLNVGRNVRKTMGSVESFASLPAALFEQTGKVLGGVAGSIFYGTYKGYAAQRRQADINRAEKTGVIRNQHIGQKLVEKKLADIARQEKSLANIYEGLKKDPSSQVLRQELYSHSLKLMNNISRTSEALKTVGDVAPDIKKKFSGKLEESGKKMDDFMKKQEFLDPKIFKSIQEAMQKMAESIKKLIGMKKQGPDVAPA